MSSIVYLNEEQERFKETVTSFVNKEIKPNVLEWESLGYTPRKLWKRCGDLGFLGIVYPEEYGGIQADYIYNFIWAQEMAKCGSLGVALGLTVQTDMATPALSQYGSSYLKENFLKPAIKGDYICSIAISEPDCGSDVASIKTKAEKSGDDYILNGQKMFITNGTQADFLTVLAKTSAVKKYQGFSLFVVPSTLEGFTKSKSLPKICYPSSDTAVISFENLRLPSKYLIGDEGSGFYYQTYDIRRIYRV